MIKSMTGFGKSVFEHEKKICIEIRTLNSKQLDINTKICKLYREKESEIRSIAGKELERGKIDISIFFDNKEETSNYSINKSLLIKYYQDLKAVSIEAKNDFPSDYFALALKMPDILSTGNEELSDEEWQVFLTVFNNALNKVSEFRLHEGKILEKDLTKRIKLILQLLEDTIPYEKTRINYIRERIEKDIEELIGKGKIDKNRFEEELIYYIEKIDITEERVRLKKHCDYFLETIKQAEANGRKLGFISQEIGREINTLGSKANDAEIQKIVVQMKDELEKIKEQLLNIL